MSNVRLEQLAPRLTHPLVRSLAWLIGSPGLLDPRDARFKGRLVGDDWCSRALADATPWLLGLDGAPQELVNHVQARPTRRLGRLAEALIAFWLEHAPETELLACNLPVREGGRTLGEFDFILREQGANRATHWESAVKFYLQLPDAQAMSGYVGPGDNDTLGAKVDKVFQRQLALRESSAGRKVLAAAQVEELDARAFLKGWLFYEGAPGNRSQGADAPGLSKTHWRGWWLRCVPGWEQALDDACGYVILPRLQWLAWPWRTGDAGVLDRSGLLAALGESMAEAADAVMVVQMHREPGAAQWIEQSRGFVAPAAWGRAGA